MKLCLAKRCDRWFRMSIISHDLQDWGFGNGHRKILILFKCDNLELLSGIQIFMDCFQEVVRDIEVFCEENCKERKSIIGELNNE